MTVKNSDKVNSNDGLGLFYAHKINWTGTYEYYKISSANDMLIQVCFYEIISI